MLTNQKGVMCRHPCDPFGHHSFCCKVTNKTSDHNHARDIICSMTQALGFISSKEVVVFPWAKKPDVELVDPSGELLTFFLDVTLPALHQEGLTTREDIFKNARKIKNKSYPRKDAAGRLLTESTCLPFILSSMGGLCKEGHEFLKICKKKDPFATLRMVDVLVTQHSKWTARKIRRALFGQSLVDFNADPWNTLDNHDGARSNKEPPKMKPQKKQSRLEKAFSQVESQSSQTTTHTASTPSTVVEVHSSQEVTPTENPIEETLPNGTVYFSNDPYSQNASYFQDFSAFQQRNFQTSFQQPFQYPISGVLVS